MVGRLALILRLGYCCGHAASVMKGVTLHSAFWLRGFYTKFYNNSKIKDISIPHEERLDR